MRRRIFELIRKAGPGDKASRIYDWFIMVVAIISIVPMMFRNPPEGITGILETVSIYFLFLDYILRWITCDYHTGKSGIQSFLIYPFTPFAVMDILSILPSLGLLPPAFRVLRLLRLGKLLHYSRSFVRITNVFKKQGKTLLAVLNLAIAYVVISALIMFVSEPEQNFPQFFDALYWATTALTTVGYGDIYPSTDVGKFISMLSSLFGVAVIAMPAGIVTAGFLDELKIDLSKTEKKLEKVSKLSGAFLKRSLLIMGVGVGLDIGLYYLGHVFHLPAWLDSLGTVLAAVMIEPTAGLLVAFASTFFQSAFVYGVNSLLFYLIGGIAALSFGLLLNRDSIKIKRLLLAMLIYFAAGTVIAGLLTLWKNGGIPDSGWEYRFYTWSLNRGYGNALSCFFGTAVLKLVDTLVIGITLPVLIKISRRLEK
ncbi:ion transporter [Ohessyouella blattaphilus]|uniref:Ion transporter n=1 Tax=Ohessyouella blattaphilus TaxID=2949333 RepID=A0ABT1EIB5_9FIRM|nr:ion transporter [Ohessyouella blattaphilus]MCP1110448.1 ion transporter [Ohessyouella blattaphilus]MCR8563842.1 ion transporter [Ohessyouella blattaphilus]